MPVRRYIKRPDQIEAIPAHEAVDAAAHDWAALPQWLRDDYDNGRVSFSPDAVRLDNALGTYTASGQDMIVYEHGTTRVIPADPFAAGYTLDPDTAP